MVVRTLGEFFRLRHIQGIAAEIHHHSLRIESDCGSSSADTPLAGLLQSKNSRVEIFPCCATGASTGFSRSNSAKILAHRVFHLGHLRQLLAWNTAMMIGIGLDKTPVHRHVSPFTNPAATQRATISSNNS